MVMKQVWSGSPWESRYGYCRAIRAGGAIFVTGTAPVGEDGQVVHVGDAKAQTIHCYTIIDKALAKLGADKRAITRCRLFVTDIARADEFGLGHKEFFDGHAPCMTMVEVSRLIHADMLVEIEVDGVV